MLIFHEKVSNYGFQFQGETLSLLFLKRECFFSLPLLLLKYITELDV